MSAFRPPSSDRNPWSNRGGGGGGGSGGGGRGGFWRRVIAPTDNPLDWALPLGSFRGIAVRVGLLYIAWMVFQIVPNLGASSGILAGQLWMLGSLFVLVLLHEFGHCFACRWVGGEADDILMWPLGGLASCRPPHTWKANFITTAGGPLVNVALVPVLGGVLLALGQGWNVLIFNPLLPFDIHRNLSPSAAPEFVSGWLLTMLFWMYYTNWVLLLFNVLVPMFPMDSGRLLQALLWRRLGWKRSMEIATTIGLVAAVGLGLFAVTSQAFVLFGIALFGGITCYVERQRLRMMGGPFGNAPEEESPWAASLRDEPAAAPSKRQLAQQRKAQAQAEADRRAKEAETAELDRILAKIKNSGMGSLTRTEETFLRRTNEKMNKP